MQAVTYFSVAKLLILDRGHAVHYSGFSHRLIVQIGGCNALMECKPLKGTKNVELEK